jgi:hypothetical protein
VARRLCLALLISVSAVCAAPVSAQEVSPDWFRTWHLDVAASTFLGPVPYSRGTWTVRRDADGGIVMVYDQVGTRGGVVHMEWKGQFDGRDRRLHGPDAVVTYAYTVVDERTLDLIIKVDTRPAAAARVVLGADGTVTATTDNYTARGTLETVTIYRRERPGPRP